MPRGDRVRAPTGRCEGRPSGPAPTEAVHVLVTTVALVATVAILALAATLALPSTGTAAPAAAPILVVGLAGHDELSSLVGWIAGGAGVVGVLLYGVGTVAGLGVAPELLLAAGIAVGGGLGGVVRLLAVGETEPEPAETVTFARDSEPAGGSPDPRPADLFEESPDPILYFDDAGEGPVVRAVNPAYERVFGASSAAVEDAALGDALMVAERAGDVVAAARDGEEFRATVECETADGPATCRLRLATVSDEAGVRGYVLYAPLSA